ncbi:hypothetical protein [Methanolobus tindarius]|nr:hypothetical protein [Methanolobus tindarius]
MTPTNRLTITLAPYLREKLVKKAKEYGCSQAEVLRIAFIRLLEDDG